MANGKLTEEMTLSGKELVAYIRQFKNAKEFAEKHKEAIYEFVTDVKTLAASIGNLYEASKVALALGGVVVTVEVTAMGERLFKANIGDESSADKLSKMLKGMADE